MRYARCVRREDPFQYGGVVGGPAFSNRVQEIGELLIPNLPTKLLLKAVRFRLKVRYDVIDCANTSTGNFERSLHN